VTPRVVLVGPPGAGKTTVGRKLAARLGLPLQDTDTAVEQAAGRKVAAIFTTDGEPAFRGLEEHAVLAGLASHRGVLSLGGGAVLSARTRAALSGHTVVFLNVGMAEGARRTGMSGSRPILAGINPRATFKALLDARLPLYREVATIEVLTDGLPAAAVTEAVLAQLPPDASGVGGTGLGG